MTEPVNPSTINLRSKGLSNSCGKIYKGCVKDATTKLAIGSIPSPYEAVIYKTDSKKAFGTSQKRFFDKETLLPSAHSNEDLSTAESTPNESKINHNKVGQNAFISKDRRDWFRPVRTPGPGQYYKHQGVEGAVEPRRCFTRKRRQRSNQRDTRMEQQKVQKQQTTPGPGQYIFDKKQFWKTTTKGWKSSFESKLSRDAYIPESISPGPWSYQQQIEKAIKNKEKKPDQKEDKKPEKNDVAAILSLFTKSPPPQPGPGTYSQEIPTFKPLYERVKVSRNFMAPLFTGSSKSKQAPGPTAYQVKRMYEDLEPKLIQSTCFMSETVRDPFRPVENLGPNLETPKLPGSKNFHFNIKNEWMC